MSLQICVFICFVVFATSSCHVSREGTCSFPLLVANCLVSAEKRILEVDVATQKPKLINSYHSFSVKKTV